MGTLDLLPAPVGLLSRTERGQMDARAGASGFHHLPGLRRCFLGGHGNGRRRRLFRLHRLFDGLALRGVLVGTEVAGIAELFEAAHGIGGLHQAPRRRLGVGHHHRRRRHQGIEDHVAFGRVLGHRNGTHLKCPADGAKAPGYLLRGRHRPVQAGRRRRRRLRCQGADVGAPPGIEFLLGDQSLIAERPDGGEPGNHVGIGAHELADRRPGHPRGRWRRRGGRAAEHDRTAGRRGHPRHRWGRGGRNAGLTASPSGGGAAHGAGDIAAVEKREVDAGDL